MTDESKTNSQLLEEVAQLHQQIKRLEKSEARCLQSEKNLRDQTFIDELTDLYNRRGFLVMGQQQIKIGSRTKKPVLLLFGDLDDLKNINDNYGHPAGDQALRDVAYILRGTFRESDVISRLGGDEFAVVALVNENGSPDIILKRIDERTRQHNLKQGRPYNLSLSVGIAECNPEQSCSISELLRQADEAMYRKKTKHD
ncbi:MAG: GGDEF domain-containing protein [Dehalogenimonas sp.]